MVKRGGSRDRNGKLAHDNARQKQADRAVKSEFKRQRQRGKYQGSSQYVEDLQRLSQQLAPFNLAIRDVNGDGNCLFRALSLQLHDDQDHHSSIRASICDFVECQRESFEPFVEDDIPWDQV
jgi:OTU domain-containing protein 3